MVPRLGALPLGEGEGCEALSSRWRMRDVEKIMIFFYDSEEFLGISQEHQ